MKFYQRRAGYIAGLAGLALLLLLAPHARAGAWLTNSTPANGQIVLSWSSRGTLEMAGQITGPWTALTNSWPYTNQIAGSTRYFRLNQTVDATTLHKKVLCGYQGWFRCAGDDGGSGNEWDHWSANWSAPPTTNTITFEMWPEVTDYSNSYPAPGFFTSSGGAQSYLYSAIDQQVVNEHFDLMQDYGIDGVVVQRFVTALPPQNTQAWKTNVLLNARAAANRTGRVFFLEYDMSGADTNLLFSQLTNDWTYLYNTLKIPQDPRYLHHNGKPVVLLFGFYTNRFAGTALPQQIVNWFETNTLQPVTLIGSGDWQWRTQTAPGWAALYRSFSGYCPWNTGNYSIDGTNDYATTSYWAADLQAATNAGMFYWPEIYPGYSAFHLTGGPFNQVPRIGGVFLWKQFNAVSSLGLDWCYLGMFDEVDEGTAIYKVSNTPPTVYKSGNAAAVPVQFLDYNADGTNLPSDWYLRLAAEGSKIMAGERPNNTTIPISP